jgi:hypothetical protein
MDERSPYAWQILDIAVLDRPRVERNLAAEARLGPDDGGSAARAALGSHRVHDQTRVIIANRAISTNAAGQVNEKLHATSIISRSSKKPAGRCLQGRR